MKRTAHWKAAAVGTAAVGLLGSTLALSAGAGAVSGGTAKHVLLISVDGLHASDLATCEANAAAKQPGGCPTLASLAGDGTTYTDAHASEPSDSAPGLMALVTGGDPKLKGVYYDDSYDRTGYKPVAQIPSGVQNCTGPAGTEAAYFENLDAGAPTAQNPNNPNRPIMNARLDPTQFVYSIQNGKCQPLAPNDFLRSNSIFSVAHQSGMYTAWADKHPVYNAEIAGDGTPDAVNDPFNTEINADIVPPQLTDTRDVTVSFNPDNPDGTGPFFLTDSMQNVESYDQIKVDAILNQIDGFNSAHTERAPVPAIFGMNFQTVSVGQKLVRTDCRTAPCAGYVPGGYEPGSTSTSPVFTPQLAGGIESVDKALKSMVDELSAQKVLSSTTIIITAKHGQSPIDPSKLALIGHAEQDVLTNAGVNIAQLTDDDVALIWLADQGQTSQAVSALNADKSGANTAHIQTVLSGQALAAQFNSPTQDPRTPDIIVEPIPGTIYSHSSAKVMEHGGFAEDDTHVAMLVVNGANIGTNTPGNGSNNTAVRTYQVAPTILSLLGLNPNKLDSVRTEGVKVLPGQ
ncbi:MAG TPA: alkaline phosphatase family protein [Acidimicrobiales bacterium]|nr:alkaline phosphatase family protein [Acidimicrobiales bacterium]